MSKYDEVTSLVGKNDQIISTSNEELLKKSFNESGELKKYKVIKIERENGAAGLITKIKVDL